MKILIADDSSLSRKLVAKSLPESLTCEITQACNGEEALNAYQAGGADLIFLDLTMPVMDGFETLRRLKALGDMPKVIVVSADIQPLARQTVMELGAAAFVRKPVSHESMINILHETGVL